ncbi:hypothetical protein ACVWY0_001119 [Arthrobacter sp. UYNi723]
MVSREEQAARRAAGKSGPGMQAKGAGKKSLDIGMPPGMIQRASPEILNPGGAEKQEPGVVGASAHGFVGGVMAGAQMNMGSTTPDAPGQGDDVLTKEDSVKNAEAAAASINKVVMNPEHIARLEALTSQQNDGLESGGGRYGR